MTILHFNPQDCAIESIASESALGTNLLTVSGLRQRFILEKEWTLENTDENFIANPDHLQAAAVLIPLVIREHGLQVLLTKRTAHLRDHAGQISFPGGRMDDTDTSPEMTALRETQEEVGLHSRHIEILGRLPQYRTITGYAVTPVVSLVLPPFQLTAETFEVESIFEVPFDFLMNPRHHQRRILSLPNGLGMRQFYAMPYQEHFIWGASAGMLRNLFHFLRAE